ncbi:glutathione peroxidase [Pseudoroseomonas globiformis]|uniref:Glutathione peroxidase n=1 Tax=Teichococcus globiformis TaxID=2307229 RepID=A0ABV7G3R9_9PROT
MTDFYALSAQRGDGAAVPFSDFRGQVLLVVNTASQCGFTPQYAGLESLQQEFGHRGFNVLAFPCNQFGRQEPGGDEAIATFCTSRFQTTFPIFAKVEVNGAAAHPVFRLLKSSRPGLLGIPAIKWNFTKFLVDRHGAVVGRYAPTTKPADLREAIVALL